MDISVTELNTKKRVDFEGSPDLKEYYSNEVKDIKNLKVSGTIIDNDTDDYEIKMNIKGTLVLKSVINSSDVLE